MTSPHRMTPPEKKSCFSLAGLFALRMFGLFVILPVFASYARGIPGGENAFLVGLALGVYGLTQGLLQIPSGAASDRFGRRPVIAAGLAVFALGSFAAASAGSVEGILLGRALQGAGAISAAVTAFLSDSVRAEVITRAMAVVGASIGTTFALSLAAAPILARLAGVPGIFVLTGLLALLGIGVLFFVVPAPRDARARPDESEPKHWSEVLLDPQLLRVNLGVFLLHGALAALFVVLPGRLESLGVPVPEHWKLYLPAVLFGFAAMGGAVVWSERRGHVVGLLRSGAALLVLVFLLLAACGGTLPRSTALLGLYFAAFNVLEATLPGLASRLAPRGRKGLALGVFNTTQNLGFFAGGALGGAVAQQFSVNALS